MVALIPGPSVVTHALSLWRGLRSATANPKSLSTTLSACFPHEVKHYWLGSLRGMSLRLPTNWTGGLTLGSTQLGMRRSKYQYIQLNTQISLCWWKHRMIHICTEYSSPSWLAVLVTVNVILKNVISIILPSHRWRQLWQNIKGHQ